MIQPGPICIITPYRSLIDMLTRVTRKNTGSRTPPSHGGFAVIKAAAVLTVISLAVSLGGGLTPAFRFPAAGAQEAPTAAAPAPDRLVNEVVTLDAEINTLNAKLSGLESRSRALQARIEATSSKIEERRVRLAARRQALAARMRSMYVNGRTSKLAMLVSSRDVSDYMNRAAMLEKVAERDARMIADTKRESEQLNASLASLKSDKREIDGVASELGSRRRRLERSRSERASVLATAGAKGLDAQAQAGRVEAKMERINPRVPVTGRPTGKVMMMVATAYSPQEPGLDESTASGMRATRGVVAVDPRVIPLGTRLHVEGYGNCIAGDTGSAIKGNRIDLCFDTLEEMEAFGGYRTVRVEILD